MGIRYGVFYCVVYIVCCSVLAIVYPGGWGAKHWLDTIATIASASIGISLLTVTSIEGVHAMVLLAPRIKAKFRKEGREEAQREIRELLKDPNLPDDVRAKLEAMVRDKS